MSVNPPGRTLFQSILLIAEMFQNVVHQKIIKTWHWTKKIKEMVLAGFVWKDSLNWTAMLEQAGYQHFSEVKPNCDFSFIQLPFIFHGWWTWFISVWPHTRLHILLTQWLCLSLFLQSWMLFETIWFVGIIHHWNGMAFGKWDKYFFLLNWSVGWDAKIVLDPLSLKVRRIDI